MNIFRIFYLVIVFVFFATSILNPCAAAKSTTRESTRQSQLHQEIIDPLLELKTDWGIEQVSDLLQLPPEKANQIPHRLLRELYLRYLGAPLRYVPGQEVGTREYSIADYIRENGQPRIYQNTLLLQDKDLTSLQGIDLIENPERIERITFDYNMLSNYVDSNYPVTIDPNTNIPDKPFQRFINLKSLDLQQNKFYTFPAAMFEGLGNLRVLNLHLNQLPSLPENVFLGLGKLKKLLLYDNRLSSLPQNVFQGLENLEELNLSSNQLSSLPDNIFKGLGKLKDLNFYTNRLVSLPANVFQGLEGLQVLSLSGNKLTSLPENLFLGLNNLKSLSLSVNWLGDEENFIATHFLPASLKFFGFKPQHPTPNAA